MSSRLETPGYTVDKVLHSGKSSDVYAGVRQVDGKRVVLKRYTQAASIDSAPRHEWEALTRVAGPGIPCPIELIEDTRPVLVLEYAPGVPLGGWSAVGEVEIATLLELGTRLVEVLDRVHTARLLHRDLHPHNILVDETTRTVHLIDLGRCRPMGARATCIASSHPIGGSLHFIAPEQTGRMNRGCDPRSDLYSLGAVLYFALTGRPPLDGRDKLEIIHAHIARRPRDPREIRPDIPGPLAEVVLRLLAKEPEERYPSAAALLRDLRTLSAELQEGGELHDRSLLRSGGPRVGARISQASFGRPDETQLLLAAYAAARSGTTQLILIDGDLGTGKSSFARVLRVPVAETQGYLAAATFASERNRAYAGWAELLQSLADQVLLESDERLDRWRRRLVDAVGAIASVLIELAPNLRFVLPDAPEVPTLGPLETRARLSLAVRRMIEVFAEVEHPLVLFLDDLHSSDEGTRHALCELVPRDVPGRALLIVATLDSTARDGSIARELIEAAERGDVQLRRITLGPLSRAQVEQALADVLERCDSRVSELAGWVERKTNNNPLLIQEFLDHLHERGLVAFNASRGWHWDIDEIAALSVSDDAATLLTERLEGLGEEARQIVCLATSCGDPFDVALLRELTDLDPRSVDEAAYHLADMGLIVPCDRGFRFAHDQIRDAARGLLTQQEHVALHGRIAKLLLERTPNPTDRIFEIADHLHRGHASLPVELHTRAIEVHRLAAARAIGSGAADVAETYLHRARSLHREQDWLADPAGSFALGLLSVDSASQRNDFDRALHYLDGLEGRCAHELDHVRLIVKRIEVLALRGEVLGALRYALHALCRYGIRWPTSPSRWYARLAVARTRWLLGRRSLARLLVPSRAADPARLAPLIILRQSAGLIARAGGELSAVSACFGLRDAIRNGYLAPPGFLVACYAIHEYRFVRDPGRVRTLAALALERRGGEGPSQDPVAGPQTESVVHSVIYPFLMRRRDALRELPRIAEQLEEVGAVEWTYYTRYLHQVYLALAGDRVDFVERALHALALSNAATASARAPIVATVAALSLLLREDVERALCEAPSVYAAFGVGPDATPPGLTLWMQSLQVWGQPEAVIELSDRVEGSIESLNPGVHVVDFALYRGLAAASLARSTSGAARRDHRRTFRRCVRRLRRWRRQGPDFEHMALLLEAENAWLRADTSRADHVYATVARRAKSLGFVNHAAIAEERRAQMLHGVRRETHARMAAGAAAALYEEWGVSRKARALRAFEIHPSTNLDRLAARSERVTGCTP